MALAQQERVIRQFFATMPPRARAALYLGVFCCFAPIGLLQGALTLTIQPWWRVAVITLFSGAVAVGYVITLMQRPRWFPLVLVAHVGTSFAMRRLLPSPTRPDPLGPGDVAALAEHLTALVVLTIASTLCAYIAFLTVIRREGLRFSSAHAEIRLARGIHASLVPPVQGRDRHLIWRGRSQPSGDVGGDLVDVVSDDRGWHACVADVSGHGVAAGVFMGMYKAAFRASLEQSAGPADLATRLNRTLAPLREPHMFVTAVCVRFTPPDRVEFVLAGHPSLLQVPAGDASARWVGESQIALGLIDAHSYTSAALTLAPGDILVLITDGILEVFNRHDHELGQDGVRLAVEQAARAGGGVAEVEAAVFEACRRHGPQLDDQTLLVIRRDA